MKKELLGFIVLALVLVLQACDSSPKVIEEDPSLVEPKPEKEMLVPQSGSDVHEVVVTEILQAGAYTYINAKEGNQDPYWVAIPSDKNAEVGDTYYYRGGLPQKDFRSREFDRVFETLILVSEVSKDPLKVGPAAAQSKQHAGRAKVNVPPSMDDLKIEHGKGVTKLSDIINDKKNFEGKKVMVTGRCAKINTEIMGKNWIHLQDGTAKKYDFTITSQEKVNVGDIITLKGVIVLDKDFGAGYKYDIIMEDAVIISE